jgi:hypothetical protein
MIQCHNWKRAANDMEAENRGGQGPIWAVRPLNGWKYRSILFF